jgi:glutathione S-transferase
MQIGADIFCDTAIISEEIIDRSKQTLAACDDGSQALAQRAETDVFFAAIRQNSPLKTALGLTWMLGLKGMMAFAKDRASFSAGHKPAEQSPAAAKRVFREFLNDLEQQLVGKRYVSGASPSLSDFCCYHPIFLAQGFKSIKPHQIPETVRSWMTRMAEIGWGDYANVEASDALGIAKMQDPRSLPSVDVAHEDVGEWVTVTPTDTARVPVTGTLVSLSAERIIIARRSEDVGLCHIHFPRHGFTCERIR